MSPTAPRTPRPGSVSTSPPTGAGPSPRCRPSPTARTSRSDRSIAASPSTPQRPAHPRRHRRRPARLVVGQRRPFHAPGAAKVGVYETTRRRRTWQLTLSQDTDAVDPRSPNGADFFRGGISKIKFDPTHTGVVYASMFDYGLFREGAAGTGSRSTRSRPPATRHQLDNRVEFALATLPSGKTRIYLGDSTYYDRRRSRGAPPHRRRHRDRRRRARCSRTRHRAPRATARTTSARPSAPTTWSWRRPPGQPRPGVPLRRDELRRAPAFGGPGSSNGRASCGRPTPACTSPT